MRCSAGSGLGPRCHSRSIRTCCATTAAMPWPMPATTLAPWSWRRIGLLAIELLWLCRRTSRRTVDFSKEKENSESVVKGLSPCHERSCSLCKPLEECTRHVPRDVHLPQRGHSRCRRGADRNRHHHWRTVLLEPASDASRAFVRAAAVHHARLPKKSRGRHRLCGQRQFTTRVCLKKAGGATACSGVQKPPRNRLTQVAGCPSRDARRCDRRSRAVAALPFRHRSSFAVALRADDPRTSRAAPCAATAADHRPGRSMSLR